MASAVNSLSIPLPNGARLQILSCIPFAIIHIAALSVLWIHFRWSYLITCVAVFLVRMFFVTAGYHRYFSHRSFKTSRWFQFVIAVMATTSTQKGVLWWAAHHRHHHRFSDQEEDLHSPTLFGFFWAHIGWIVSDKYNDTRTQLHRRLRQISRAALAQQILSGAAHDSGRRPLADRWLGTLRSGASA